MTGGLRGGKEQLRGGDGEKRMMKMMWNGGERKQDNRPG